MRSSHPPNLPSKTAVRYFTSFAYTAAIATRAGLAGLRFRTYVIPAAKHSEKTEHEATIADTGTRYGE